MSHVEERLLERALPTEAELAHDLLRDRDALVALLREWSAGDKRVAIPERLALALAPGQASPHLLVSADGHGITCLQTGMHFDVPAVPFAVGHAFAVRQRRALRKAMALGRLTGLEEQGWTLRHALTFPHNLDRAGFERLRLVSPLLGAVVHQAISAITDHMFQLQRLPARRPLQRQPGIAEAEWQLTAAACMGVMAGGFEPGIETLVLVAAAAPDCLLAQRGAWLMTNQPQVLLPAIERILQRPTRAFHQLLAALLDVVSARFSTFRPEAARLRKELEARGAPPAPPGWTDGIAEPARAAVERELADTLRIHLPLWGTPELVSGCCDGPALQQAVALARDTTRPAAERAAPLRALLHGPSEDMDALRDWDRPAPRALKPPAAARSAAARRVELWRRCLHYQGVALWARPAVAVLLMSLAPQEALVPGATRDELWSMSFGRGYLRDLLPVILTGLREEAPRAAAAPQRRPNDPCACGSGKKHKKCCGVAA